MNKHRRLSASVLSIFLFLLLSFILCPESTRAACSSYMGKATINEVHNQGQNLEKFIEIKILDGTITSAVYDNWTVTICEHGGSCLGPISLSLANDSTLPWIVIEKALITDPDYIDLKDGTDVLLKDSGNNTIDYVSFAGYTVQQDAACTPVYDWDMASTNSHTAKRVVDGIGDWEVDPGGSGDPTEGTSNDPVIQPSAEYRLDACIWNGTSGEVIDSSGNNYDGTAYSSSTADSGQVCRSGDFTSNSTTDYVALNAAVLHTAQDFTVSVWLNTHNTPDQVGSWDLQSILSGARSGQTNAFGIELAYTNQHIYITYDDNTDEIDMGVDVTDNQWHHLVVARSGSNQNLYVDGALVDTRAVTSSALNISALIMGQEQDSIGGGFDLNQDFEGLLDELVIYHSALTTTEINTLYNYQLAGNNFDGSSRTCSTCIAPSDTFVLSTSSGAILGSPSLTLDESDLVEYSPSNKVATLVEHIGDLFQPAWFPWGGADMVNAAHTHSDGLIYFSPEDSGRTLASLGNMAVDSDDILAYDASGGTLVRFFDGDSHFSSGSENIDALYIQDNGNIILSTTGGATLGGISFADEDLVEYNPTTRVATLYFDGSSHFSGNEDLNGIHILDSSTFLISTDGSATIGSGGGALSFRNGDVVQYDHVTKNASLFFDGVVEFGSWENIDAITVLQTAGASIDHYEIIHDGSALICGPEDIVIAACATSDCSTLAAISTTATMSPAGWVGGDDITFTGSITASLRQVTPGVVTLAMSNEQPAATNGYICTNSLGGPAVSCDLEFFEAGFIFTVPTQTSCKPSDSISIEAVRTDPLTGEQCIPAFANRSVDISFWSNYINPATGSEAVTVNGTTISGASPGTGITLLFDANGRSNFTTTYGDAGQMQLDTSFSGTGDETGLVMTGNSSYVVHPAGLCIYTDDTDNDCASQDGSCSPFVAAGTSFNLRVKGVCWQSDGETNDQFCTGNTTTDNFQLSGIGLSHTLKAPLSGVSGSIDISSVDITTNGEASVNQVVSEVGVFTFTADPPADYLGAGDVFAGATYDSAPVGRFVPDHFQVTILPDPPAFAESCLIFTYLGEPFDWDSIPDLTVTAMNGATPSVMTQNYEADFWKLGTDLTYTYLENTSTQTLSPAGGTKSYTDTSDCNGSVTISLTETPGLFTYDRPAVTSPVAPFVPDVTLAVSQTELTDTDTVCYDAGSGCTLFAISGITGNNQRHGRAVAENVYGPETEPLIMPVYSLWYDGSNWQKNSDDSCSPFTYVATPNGITATITPASPSILTAGNGNLTLSPLTDTAPAGGTILIDFDFPDWLHPDPSATATFGISRGNDRVINWQEIVR